MVNIDIKLNGPGIKSLTNDKILAHNIHGISHSLNQTHTHDNGDGPHSHNSQEAVASILLDNNHFVSIYESYHGDAEDDQSHNENLDALYYKVYKYKNSNLNVINSFKNGILLNKYKDGNQRQPSIAQLSSNYYVVVWQSNSVNSLGWKSNSINQDDIISNYNGTKIHNGNNYYFYCYLTVSITFSAELTQTQSNIVISKTKSLLQTNSAYGFSPMIFSTTFSDNILRAFSRTTNPESFTSSVSDKINNIKTEFKSQLENILSNITVTVNSISSTVYNHYDIHFNIFNSNTHQPIWNKERLVNWELIYNVSGKETNYQKNSQLFPVVKSLDNDYFIILWRGRTSSSNTNTKRNNIYSKYYKFNKGDVPTLNESDIIYNSDDSTEFKAENWNYETDMIQLSNIDNKGNFGVVWLGYDYNKINYQFYQFLPQTIFNKNSFIKKIGSTNGQINTQNKENYNIVINPHIELLNNNTYIITWGATDNTKLTYSDGHQQPLPKYIYGQIINNHSKMIIPTKVINYPFKVSIPDSYNYFCGSHNIKVLDKYIIFTFSIYKPYPISNDLIWTYSDLNRYNNIYCYLLNYDLNQISDILQVNTVQVANKYEQSFPIINILRNNEFCIQWESHEYDEEHKDIAGLPTNDDSLYYKILKIVSYFLKPQTTENYIYPKKKMYICSHEKMIQDKKEELDYMERKNYRDKINKHWIIAIDKNGKKYKYNTITKYSKWI